MPSGDASVDVGDASFTNDGEVGTVEMYEYEGQPSGVGSPNLPGHRTKIQYYDLRTTGLTDGDAELELEYDERQLRQSHIDEGSVELQYWQDGEWQSTEVDRNPDDDTIETEVPVEDLSGTVFVLSGREMSQEEIWLDQALRLYDEYTAPVVGALAVVLVGLFMLVQRLRRFRG